MTEEQGPPFTHTVPLGDWKPCEACDGAGEFEGEACRACDGEGGFWVGYLPSYTISDVTDEVQP